MAYAARVKRRHFLGLAFLDATKQFFLCELKVFFRQAGQFLGEFALGDVPTAFGQ
jgi:hypothetical protein